MYKVKIYITQRESILDPAGTAVLGSLHKLGFNEATDVRIGKLINLTMEKTDNIEQRVTEMCEKLLANTVMEDYRYEIEEVN